MGMLRNALILFSILLPFAAPAHSYADTIIDNGGAGTSYTGWWDVSSAAGRYGSTSLYSSGGSTYSWRASLSSGSYDVYAWWTAFSNRSTSAPYTVTYSGGSKTISVNQRLNGGKWNYLGTFSFTSGSGVVKLSAPSAYPVTYSADAVKFVPKTSTAADEHVYACFGYGPYAPNESYPDDYFIWRLRNMGAVNVGTNLWRYYSSTTRKNYYVHIVRDIAGTKQALLTPGATVMIWGHANFGLGPVFGSHQDMLNQSIADVRYVDDPRIFNISSLMVGVEVYNMIHDQAYPNWWPRYQDGTTAIMPYKFGDARGAPPYNYYLTYRVPGNSTYHKIDSTQRSALQRFPDSGKPAWYSSTGALPNPTTYPQYYITKSTGSISAATPHYGSRTIVKRKGLEISQQDMKYSRLLYLACFSGIYFLDTFNRGVAHYTVNNAGLHGGWAFYLYFEAYTKGKSDYEIWQVLQGQEAVFDYYNFNKLPSQQ